MNSSPGKKRCGCGTCSVIKIIIILVITLVVLSAFIQNTSVFFRKRILLPFTMHLSKQDIVLRKGEEDRLYMNAINKRVSYSTTNFRVVGVNFNGRIFAYRTGKSFIIANVEGKKYKCRVRVIDLNKDKVTLSVGKSFQLKVRGPAFFPKWKSSNPKVASVSIFGKVKARGRGRTVVSAKWKGKELKCVVVVR
ncbi:MAG: hypothetical protein E7255_05340 [Lachnospiraceae bacterium]|nr:hypothetical protein [Lachnospiraceae bacterium]